MQRGGLYSLMHVTSVHSVGAPHVHLRKRYFPILQGEAAPPCRTVMCFYSSGLSQPLLRFRALFDLVQPEPCGFLPAVLGQYFVRGRRLGKQRVKVHIIVIGVKVAGGIAIQLRQAAGTGQGDGCPRLSASSGGMPNPSNTAGCKKPLQFCISALFWASVT